jgi:hypothetical protein
MEDDNSDREEDNVSLCAFARAIDAVSSGGAGRRRTEYESAGTKRAKRSRCVISCQDTIQPGNREDRPERAPPIPW